jgi:hypothetical protein
MESQMHDAEQIIAALERQLVCYQKLAKLADSQADHVRQGSTEALLGLLQDRAAVLEEVTGLESILAPARKHWSEFTGPLADDRRAYAESLVRQTRSLLETITSRDQEDVMVLQQQKLNVGRQIGQASATRSVHRAYGGAAFASNRAAAATRSNVDLSQ